jgi:hypothetical protein
MRGDAVPLGHIAGKITMWRSQAAGASGVASYPEINLLSSD